MSIDRREIERIAALARLELSDDELEGLADDCRQILQHFEALREIDELDPPPAREGGLRLRADRVAPDPLRRSPDVIAPAWERGFFVLPRLPALDTGVATRDATGDATDGAGPGPDRDRAR